MFAVHIDLTSQPAQDLVQTFIKTFRPVISSQPGFVDTQLMRSTDDPSKYRLTIVFDNEQSQQHWVAADIHQEVWHAMELLCTDVVVQKYNTVSDTA